MSNSISFDMLPTQSRFLQSEARETLLSGGLGAGKSLALCAKLVSRAVVPGARELLVRKTNATIRRSILQTLLEGDGMTPPVLPAGTYTHNLSEQVIEIKGGGRIDWTGIDQPQKLGSVNATGAAVEEGVELSEADYRMARGRVRVQVPGLPCQTYITTNPGGPTHHLAIRFGLDGEHDARPGCMAMTVCTDENPHLPAEYVADYASLSGTDRARFYEGRWVKAEGLIYSGFDSSIMVQHREADWKRIIVGQDAGFNDPDALIVVCQDQAGAIHVADEFVESGQLTSAVVKQAQRFREKYNASRFAVDPSAARLRAELEQAGLPVGKAQNAILDGIRAVQKYMVSDGAGVPRFTVEPHCVRLLKELGSYVWSDRKADQPIDKHNHALDALRYGVCEMEDHREMAFYTADDFDDFDDDHDDHEWHSYRTPGW